MDSQDFDADADSQPSTPAPTPTFAAASGDEPASASTEPHEPPDPEAGGVTGPAAPIPEDSVLSARGIRKGFRIGNRTLEVLHGVNIDLIRGERLCLMGASGAGKSTLLHTLGLLEQPSEGHIYVQGQDAWDLSVKKRARLRNAKLGFVFQFYHLLPELNALENTLIPAMIAESTSGFRRRRSEHVKRAEALLVAFGLEDRLRHRPGQLSGGERQRIALARALLNDPEILIADEPTGNLDSGTGERVLELLFAEQERRSLSLLLVTHDRRLGDRCDRVLYMEDGLIQADSAVPVPD